LHPFCGEIKSGVIYHLHADGGGTSVTVRATLTGVAALLPTSGNAVARLFASDATGAGLWCRSVFYPRRRAGKEALPHIEVPARAVRRQTARTEIGRAYCQTSGTFASDKAGC